jgi:choline-sulfatase
VHRIRAWDNAFPYDGTPPSWGHKLIARGHRVAAIGKLHYRSDADDNGFSEKIDTMNVVDGVGDRLGWLRREGRERGAARQLAEMAGRGESTYTQYDRRVAQAACEWLGARAASPGEPPWVLFVGFVMPHLP